MGLNIRLALRFLWKNKLFSFINIAGLSLGLACCFIILLHVRYETGFDRFHANKDRIVRVIHQDWRSTYTPYVMADAMTDYFPEIEKSVRIAKLDWLKFYVVKEKDFIEEHHAMYADSTFFEIFSFPVISGDPSKILRSPDKIMLSESMAKKFLGSGNPLGKTISMRLFSTTHTFTVEGIYKDFPEQSHFHARCITSMKFAKKAMGEGMFTHWGANSMITYLLLRKPDQMPAVTERIPTFTEKHYPKDFPATAYALQPLSRIHLYTKNPGGDIEPQGSITRVMIFASVAILVLVIAVVNFILLSLAQSYQRIKEFGIRKVVGATRNQLVSLVSTEFLIVFILAVQIGLMLVELSIPWFKSHMNFMVYKGIFSNAGLLTAFLAAVFLLGYVSSLYITLSVSRIRPIDSLKSKLPLQKNLIPSRSILVIFQFSIMTALMVCLLVMQKQLMLLRSKDLGYRKQELLVMNVPQSRPYKIFLEELKKIPGVVNASAANYVPPTQQWWISYFKKPGIEERFELEQVMADYGLAETLGLEMVAGRTFSPEFGSDSLAILVNEAAVKMMKLNDPLESFVRYDNDSKIQLNIIGVFKDFHMRSLYDEIKPMAIFLSNDVIQQFAVRLSAGDTRRTVAELKKLWDSVYPDDPIEITWVDEALHLSYQKDDQSHSLIELFTFMSLAIALMGLFGLSANTVERRTKETGIRKVNGATPRDILFVLSKQFLTWIFIAFCIAMPVSWYAMNRWLQHFSYRTEISWWVYVLALLISIVIAFITIAWQTNKAARMNPVDALRYE